jgi:hypothetical protein
MLQILLPKTAKRTRPSIIVKQRTLKKAGTLCGLAKSKNYCTEIYIGDPAKLANVASNLGYRILVQVQPINSGLWIRFVGSGSRPDTSRKN